MLSFAFYAATSAFLTVAVLLATAAAARRRAHARLASRCGVPCPTAPPPSLVSGHFGQLRGGGRRCPVHVMSRWERECGPVYGLYFGPTPTVVVGDAQEVERVVAKSARTFPDRPPLAVPVAPVTESLVGLRGADWRRVRRALNPKFAPENCAAVLEPVIHEKLDVCVADLAARVADDRDGSVVNVVDVSEALCFDVVCSSVLGIRADDELFRAVRSFLSRRIDGAIKAAIYFPGLLRSSRSAHVLNPAARFLTRCAQRFGFHPKASRLLLERVRKVVEERKQAAGPEPGPENSSAAQLSDVETHPEGNVSSSKKCPFANGMSSQDRENNNNHHHPGPKHQSATQRCRRQQQQQADQPNYDILQMMLDDEDGKMSTDEIVANAWVFLLGGFDTVAQALSFTLYLLAEHPEEQEKIYKEIEANVVDPQRPDIPTVTRLPHLDKVFKESLRMFPPVNLNVSRHCEQDFQLKNSGGVIPAGANIHIPLYQLHRNPKYWKEPEKFCPARFEPELEKKQKRMSYIPFGAGPRYCIGKHFAIMEAKLSLARLIYNFRFVATEPGKELDLVLPLVTLKAASGIPLRCYRRHHRTTTAADTRLSG